MAERIEFEIVAKDKSSQQFRSTEKELQRLNKTVAAGGRGSKAAAQSLKQLRQASASLGTTLKGDTNPSLRQTSEELRRVERQARAAGAQTARLGGAIGAGTAKANAFTRAATRGVAALGFISPTAATASAQIVDLTASTGAATVAIATGAVAAIALGGALIYSSKQALAFETSFRGIRKTVNATEEEYAKLESANRSLARSLGENVNTINEIGQAAGQLGIAIGDLAQFEKIVIELASASDITARAASFSFGGLIAVLGLTIDELDSLTDQVVGLGNTFAATESEIVGLLNRIAGAGAVLKIPAQDLVSISTAFASVRVEQEAAGTAIQKVMLAVQRAAVVGGKELATFAKMLGVTEQEFRDLVRSDPTKVFVEFVNALGKSGEDAQLWLKELGLTDQRLTRTFLKLSSAGERLNNVMAEGTKAYEESTARTEEFDKALATTSGQIRIARRELDDLAITIGTALLPALSAAAGGAAEFAQALRTIGEAASFADEALSKLDVGSFDLPQIPKVPGAFQPLPKTVGLDLSPQGFYKSVLEGITPFGAVRNAVGGINDVGEALLGIVDRGEDAEEAAQNLGGALQRISGTYFEATIADIDGITKAADDARVALFAMFKEPTREEAQAKLGLLGAQQELNDLKLLQREWTAAEKERAEVLQSTVIPAAQALLKEQTLSAGILEQQAILQQNELQTMEERTRAYLDGAKGLDALNAGLTAIPDAQTAIDATWISLKRLVAAADPKTKREFNLIIATIGDKEALARLKDLLAWGGKLSAEDFVLNVRVNGADLAIAQMQALLDAGNELARHAVSFGALTADPAELLEIAASIRRESLKLPEIPIVVPPPDRGGGDKAAGAAAKAIDPLKDGIITLAEALEFGFTAATAATAELEFSMGKLQARYFRVAVESIKLERAEAKRQRQLEIGLRLAERDIERQKALIELQIEQAVQMGELRAVLAEAGLESEIDTFAFAMQSLGEEFQRAEESTLDFLRRLSAAATEAVKAQFDMLFARPTREQAELQLQLDIAELERARLARSGASEEMLAAIDDEIRQIQLLLDVRRKEEDVVRARAALADQGLLTQKEQFDQALLLTGLIAEESQLLDILNEQIDKQYFALLGATGATLDFASALQSAQDVISAQQPFGALRLGAGAAGTAGGGAINIELNVRVEDNEETRRQIHEELDDLLNEAGVGGALISTGTYVP